MDLPIISGFITPRTIYRKLVCLLLAFVLLTEELMQNLIVKITSTFFTMVDTPSVTKKSELRHYVCTHCKFDSTCGGIFSEDVPTTSIADPKMFCRISLIFSHCMHDLSWLDQFMLEVTP